MTKLFCSIFMIVCGYLSALQTKIDLIPTRPGMTGKIIPSTPAKLQATVKNTSDEPSVPGTIFIQFAFRPPHDHEPNSVLFQTEKLELPALAPSEEKVISFETPHQLPTIFDYVRHDWAMREYEVVLEKDGKQEIIGTKPLSFTGYYY